MSTAPVEQVLAEWKQEKAEMKKPLIRLPSDDYLISQFAAEIGTNVFDAGIYLRGDEIVVLTGSELRPMTAKQFRTWVEQHLYTYKMRQLNSKVQIEVTTTMTEDIAAATLASPQFRERLLRVQRVNRCRLPVMRADGKIELLPPGYDFDSNTLTLAAVEYAEDMEPVEATSVIEDLLSEFGFTDARSKAVAVAVMVGVYAAQILPAKTLRPLLVIIANAEGAGKTLLALTIVCPVTGEGVTGCKADTDDELRKLLLAAVREARPVLLLDNVRGHLSSESLEAFCSAPVWSDRKLGVNETVTADNLTQLIVTGNGLTVSPDIRRRGLFCELHLDCERAEDKPFKRPLDLPTLLSLRPMILAALWSLVRHWDTQARPAPSRSHSAFPSWAKVIGGIVEAAGWECPLNTANVTATIDQDGDDMRALVKAMAETGGQFSFAEIVTKSRELGLFETLIGGDHELDRKDKARFSRLLGRYDCRQVSNWRFAIKGKAHGRTYQVENIHGQHGQHGVSSHIRKKDFFAYKTETPCPPCAPCKPELSDQADIEARRAHAFVVHAQTGVAY